MQISVLENKKYRAVAKLSFATAPIKVFPSSPGILQLFLTLVRGAGGSVVFWGFVVIFDKGAVEHFGVFKAAASSDFFDGVSGTFQQAACQFQTFGHNIFVGRGLQTFAEEGEEAVAGEFAMLADAVAREVAAGIFLYVT